MRAIFTWHNSLVRLGVQCQLCSTGMRLTMSPAAGLNSGMPEGGKWALTAVVLMALAAVAAGERYQLAFQETGLMQTAA